MVINSPSSIFQNVPFYSTIFGTFRHISMSVAVHNADSDAKQKKNTFHLKLEGYMFPKYPSE